MSETCRLRRGEGYGVRDDEAPPHPLPPLLPTWAVCTKKREDRRAGKITTERMLANQEGARAFCLAAQLSELSR